MTKGSAGKKNKELEAPEIRVLWSPNMEQAKNNQDLTLRDYSQMSHRTAEFLLGLYDLRNLQKAWLLATPEKGNTLDDLDQHIGKTDQRSWITLLRLGYVSMRGITIEGRGENMKIKKDDVEVEERDRISIVRMFADREIDITEKGLVAIKHLIYNERLFVYFPEKWNHTNADHIHLNREASLQQIVCKVGTKDSIHPYILGQIVEGQGLTVSFIRLIHLGLFLNGDAMLDQFRADPSSVVNPTYHPKYAKILGERRTITEPQTLTPTQEQVRVFQDIGIHFKVYPHTHLQVGMPLMFVYIDGLPYIITQHYLDQLKMVHGGQSFGGLPNFTSKKYISEDDRPEKPFYKSVSELDQEFRRRSNLPDGDLQDTDYQAIRKWSNAYSHLVVDSTEFVDIMRRIVENGLIDITELTKELKHANRK